jgi:hypothetical protein
VWLLRQPKFRIIAFIYFGVILLLMLGSGKGYYSLGAYPMLLAAGGVWLEQMSFSKSWVRAVSIVLILVLALPFVLILLPAQAPLQMAENNKKWGLESLGLLKWEDQQNHLLQQDFADMLGWRELAQKAEGVYKALPTFSKAHTLVICGSYGHAGALQYYAQDAAFRKRVFSGNGSFLLWLPQPLQFENIIFIDNKPPENPLFAHFQNAILIDSVTNPLSRQYGDKIMVYKGADSTANRLARESINAMKAVFER